MSTILKPKEVANLLHVSVKTLQRWDNDEKFKAFRDSNNRRFYTKEQVDAYLNDLTQPKRVKEKENNVTTESIISETVDKINRVQRVYTKDDNLNQLYFEVPKRKDMLVNDKSLRFEKGYPHYLIPLFYDTKSVCCQSSMLALDLLTLLQTCFTKEYYLQMRDEFKKRKIDPSLLIMQRMHKDAIAYKNFAIQLLQEYNPELTFIYVVCSVASNGMTLEHMKDFLGSVPFIDITTIDEIYGFSLSLEEARNLQIKSAQQHNKYNSTYYYHNDNSIELSSAAMNLEVLPIPINKVVKRHLEDYK